MSRSGGTMNSTTYKLIYPDSRTTFSTNSLLALRELGTVFIREEINCSQPKDFNELYCFRNFEMRPLEISIPRSGQGNNFRLCASQRIGCFFPTHIFRGNSYLPSKCHAFKPFVRSRDARYSGKEAPSF